MTTESDSGQMVRALSWKGAFWVAAGVPPLVLFSIGGIAGTTGKLAFAVWIISMIMGFLQSFTDRSDDGPLQSFASARRACMIRFAAAPAPQNAPARLSNQRCCVALSAINAKKVITCHLVVSRVS